MKFQLELLENHQYEIEAALTSLEGDAHELLRFTKLNDILLRADSIRSCGADSYQLDKNDKLFYFAEGVSVQIKDVCGKIQAIHGTIDDQTVRSTLLWLVSVLISHFTERSGRKQFTKQMCPNTQHTVDEVKVFGRETRTV